MVRYYKLFDLLNRRGMKKSDLRQILSPKTVAKLSKGEYLSGEVIEKICLFLGCQPGDIMEIVETEQIDENTILVHKTQNIENTAYSKKETYAETKSNGITTEEADENLLVKRQIIDSSIE